MMLTSFYSFTAFCFLFVISPIKGCNDIAYDASSSDQELAFPVENVDNCDVVVKAPKGYQILLNVTAVNRTCCSYIKVLEENNLLGMFGVSSILPAVIVSNVEEIRIRFYTTNKKPYTGFRAVYRQAQNCGGRQMANGTSWTDLLLSSSTSLSGATVLDCYWMLESYDRDRRIEIKINSLNLQSCCDYIDVKTLGTRLLARLKKNDTIPIIYLSHGSTMTVHFHKSSNGLPTNFNATLRQESIVIGVYSTYSSVELLKTANIDKSILSNITTIRGTTQLTVVASNVNAAAKCGGTYFLRVLEGEKTLSSPNDMKQSDDNLDCIYLLYGQAHYRIQLIIELSTVDHEDCLEITEGENEPIRMHGTFVSKKVQYSSTTLKLRYRASYVNASAGFRVTYKLVQEPCEFYILAEQKYQEIFSPGYPSEYPISYDCTWTLTAPKGFQVILLLRSLQTERCCDYVEILDGTNSLGKLTGTIPTDIGFSSSAGNALVVRFKSDRAIIRRKGFSAIFKKGSNCGNEIIASKNGTLISTPGYPNEKYAESLGCSWNIRARKSMQVQVEVLDGETERCCDFVQILNGTSPIVRLLGRFDTPQSFLSTSNAMRVYFHSDEVTERRGFIARVKEVCERTFYVTPFVRSMQSPSYSAFSPNNLDCKFTFVPPSHNSTVDITILSLDTEACCDYLQVSDKVSSHISFRGHVENLQITSMQGTVRLFYHTDSKVSSKGFQILYKLH